MERKEKDIRNCIRAITQYKRKNCEKAGSHKIKTLLCKDCPDRQPCLYEHTVLTLLTADEDFNEND